ncbi:MAG: GrpE protein(hsp-70 cofactor) [uncultured bacterium]|nr:MAG: GrpE protein(hsp-70 cofactor) [uncultured bacterium]
MKSWTDGIGYIMKQFGDVLKNHGIEEIKTVGEKFDPTIHESVGEEEMEEKESGMIVREVSGGYKMGDKIVKVARVIIAK